MNTQREIMNIIREGRNKPADYWHWLARPSVEKKDAAALIAGIEPHSLHPDQLPEKQYVIVNRVIQLSGEEGLTTRKALDWLRWASAHPELSENPNQRFIEKLLRCMDNNNSANLASSPPAENNQPARHQFRVGEGLMFPYTTKSLEAACAAALEFWPELNPERPPLQKQVSAFMAKLGVPARQATELAIAIKPDGLPKT